MPDLTLTRHYSASPEAVFEAVTSPEMLSQWWGPEGLTAKSVPEGPLDLRKPGPWGSVMTNQEGQQYKVTGQVTHVDPPNSVGFTWAWHDDEDQRGAESHVTLSVEADGEGGSTLYLRHLDLPSREAADNHNMGWSSSLNKLDAIFAS